MLVNYKFRVVIWGIFKPGMTLESVNYERKLFIRLATGLAEKNEERSKS